VLSFVYDKLDHEYGAEGDIIESITREQYINHKTAKREMREAQKVFFAKYEPSFESVKDANKKMAALQKWYNTERKLITTGLTPEEMYKKEIRSSLTHPIEKAYGLVFDAMDQLDKGTKKAEMKGLTLLKDALKLDSNNEDALFIICDLTLSGKTPLDAVPYVDRLLEIEPDRAVVHLWKAQILILEDHGIGGPGLKEAAEHAAEAYSLDPENFDCVALCAQLSYWLDDQKHKEYVRNMHKLDRKRAERFMEDHFIFAMPGKGKKTSGTGG
jgi:tetratricopeptide (TPR) repeat protein